MIYSLDELKPKIKNQFFFSNISTLLYTLNRKLFSPAVFLSPLFKVYKKIVEFSFTPIKNILVFSFWFQFIHRIDHKTFEGIWNYYFLWHFQFWLKKSQDWISTSVWFYKNCCYWLLEKSMPCPQVIWLLHIKWLR